MGSLLYPLYDQTVQTQYDLSLLGLVSETSYSKSKVPNIKIIPSNSDLPSSLNQNNQTSVNKKYGYYFREGIGFYEFFEQFSRATLPWAYPEILASQGWFLDILHFQGESRLWACFLRAFGQHFSWKYLASQLSTYSRTLLLLQNSRKKS